MSDRETLDVYDAKATEYAHMTQSSVPDEQLQHFLDLLPEHSTVLDLGCGPGRSAAMIAAQGHIVTATDASAEMIALAAQQPDVTAQQATFDDLEGCELYHGVWANFSLLHADRTDLPRHMVAISQALRPGGIFHIGMKTGTDTKRDALGRRYTYVTQEELETLFTQNNLTTLRQWTGTDKGLDGTMAAWIVMQARKNA